MHFENILGVTTHQENEHENEASRIKR